MQEEVCGGCLYVMVSMLKNKVAFRDDPAEVQEGEDQTNCLAMKRNESVAFCEISFRSDDLCCRDGVVVIEYEWFCR